MEWPFIAINLDHLSLSAQNNLMEYILNKEKMQEKFFRIYRDIEKD